ncbi:MAG: FxsA family protein [Alphaproteobacteria bacterium]|nr:FxsA family protein [Alphaproteobacteria bacterium]
MLRLFFFLILAVPVIEFWLLIEVGGAIGGLNCVLLVIATTAIGGFLARRQGFDVFRRIRSRLAIGEPIVAEMIDAFALLLAGVLLLFPGLLTDMLGFLLLIPQLRKYLHSGLIGSMQQMHRRRNMHFTYNYAEQTRTPYQTNSQEEKVIDIDTTKS